VKHDFLYSVEREYNASMATVWAAWADASALQEWYHPTDLLNVPNTAQSDVRVGGRWAIGVDVPEYSMQAFFYGLYTAVVEHKLLEHTMCYTQSANDFAAMDDNAPHHKVVVNFEDRGGKTWVKFSQFGEMPAEQIPQTQAGMTSYFDSLESYLAK
jgi:uncharacterized protein YndB with AHSA1/START domain